MAKDEANCVIDEMVEATVFCHRALHQRLDLCFIGAIDVLKDGLATCRRDTRDSLCPELVVEIADDHTTALRGETLRNCTPNADARPSHNRDASGQLAGAVGTH